MLRQLLILILLTTPCYGQVMGNMSNFGLMGPSQYTAENYGNSIFPNKQVTYNYGNNPNVYDMYRPQVSDYLSPDPRQFKDFSNSFQNKLGQNFFRRNAQYRCIFV